MFEGSRRGAPHVGERIRLPRGRQRGSEIAGRIAKLQQNPLGEFAADASWRAEGAGGASGSALVGGVALRLRLLLSGDFTTGAGVWDNGTGCSGELTMSRAE